MFALALFIGIYSYVIFALGIIGFLNKPVVLSASLIFIFFIIYYFKKNKEDIPRFKIRNREFKPLLLVFGILAIVNLIGALGPELSFDALWYHLTIPKIFIQNHKIFFIEGNIFYYSLMPKLGEMLFIPGLMFGNETLAKLTQWLFGILTSIVIYKISRKYFDEKVSFFAAIIFYGSLVVAWESTVGYIDLIRTFFEIMGLWGFLNWYESRDRKWLIEAAIMIGFAISTKNLALGSILIFIILFFLSEKNILSSLKNSLLFTSVSILTALPWFIFAFLESGNPIYPFFDKRIAYDTHPPIDLFSLPKEMLDLFIHSADPISPLYLIFFPLLFIYFRKLSSPIKLIVIYSIFALIIWYITPRTGGGRFILPYLPAFSILVVAVIEQIKNVSLKKYCYILILAVFMITVFYRGVANTKFIPVILGIESKKEFLSKNLNFKYGNFYDTDGFFEKQISKKDRVLLYGFHNLYYAYFPFVHSSFVKSGEKFNYIATKDSELPERFSYWNLIYSNKDTGVNVYSLGGEMWQY